MVIALAVYKVSSITDVELLWCSSMDANVTCCSILGMDVLMAKHVGY